MNAIARSFLKVPTLRQAIRFSVQAKTKPTPFKMSIVSSADHCTDDDPVTYSKCKGRVVSPHVTIYKPQITTVLSISHRIAGAMMSVCVSAYGLAALLSSQNISEHIEMIESLELPGIFFVIFKMLLTFPFNYHLCNGIRHLVWDSGCCLDIPGIYKTGYAALAGTVILTVVLAVI